MKFKKRKYRQTSEKTIRNYEERHERTKDLFEELTAPTPQRIIKGYEIINSLLEESLSFLEKVEQGLPWDIFEQVARYKETEKLLNRGWTR